MNWTYYNHAMIPVCLPHEDADMTPINDGSIWHPEQGKPLLARWTSDFDCGKETDFWYVIKDGTYDIQAMKAKRRYEITKARKFFEVRLIAPSEFSEQLCEVQIAAFSVYPEKYRPTVNREEFMADCATWQGVCLGAFLKNELGETTDELCGYAYLTVDGSCISFSVQKTIPSYESRGINAALVDGVLTHFSEQLQNGFYICDGARNVSHETSFQSYLEKYFGFRKAYCSLHVVYRPAIRWMIPILFAFRGLLKKLDSISTVHLINSVLTMEEIKRKCAENTSKQ